MLESHSNDLDCTYENEKSFKGLYKLLKKNKESCQEERRLLFLKEIKERHNKVVDQHRDLESQYELAEEHMDVDLSSPKKKRNKYKHKLVFSEWLLEKPGDLEENWYVKLCPHGKRCLIVGKRYETFSYDRNGNLLDTFKSYLPGGGSSSQRNKLTMLECLWNSHLNCFYVLDVMYWGSIPLKNYNTDFRFYWLKSKFDELPELLNVSKHNTYQFQLVEHFPAVTNLIQEMLVKTLPDSENKRGTCDGLLFYHKETPYISGYTPLICWLKPYMLMEILSVNVHPFYMEKMPKSYTTLKDYLDQKEIKRKHPKQKKLMDKGIITVMEY